MDSAKRSMRKDARHYWMTLTGLAIIVLMMLVISIAIYMPHSVAHANGDDWSMFLGNDARTGFNANETAINSSTVSGLKLKWSFKTGGHINAQPVVANGQVYFGSWDGNEYATDLHGNKLWSASIGGQSANCTPPDVYGEGSTPDIANVVINQTNTQVLYIGGKDPQTKAAGLYALNASNGATIWETPLSTATASFVWSSPVVYNGSVYIGLASMNDCPLVQGALLQLNAVTGAIQHTFSTVPNSCLGDSIWSSPAINDATGKIFITTGNNGQCSTTEPYAQAIIELNAADLSYVDSWQVPASQHKGDSDFGATPTLFTATIAGSMHQMVGVQNKNGIYYALDQSNLHAGPLWQQTISTSTISISSSAWDTSTLYVAGRNTTISGKSCTGSLRALNPANGSFIWQDCLSGNVLAPVNVVPGVVFVGAGSHLIAVDTSTGNIRFNYATNGNVFGASSVSNGIVYVGNNGNTLYAFGVPSTSTPTPTATASPSPTSSVTVTPSTTPGTTLAQDTFIRPNQSHWGMASDGQSWGADANSLSAFSIVNNTGQVTSSNVNRYSAILGPGVTDAEVLFSGSLSNTNSNLGAVLRWTSSTNYYQAVLANNQLVINKEVNGTLTRLSSTSMSITANTSYTIRFHVVGSTLSAKAWQTGTPEPTNWMLTANDSSLTSGYCGIHMLLQSGNTAQVTFFQATMP